MATKTVDNGALTDYPVATNAGAVDDDTQRVTLASDDPAVVALQALDNAISGNEMQVDVLTMPTVAVTGTFYQATQPVSAASLPLPSGAGTSANQTTIIGHVDGIETLLGTIDTDVSVIAGDTTEIATAVVTTDAVASGAATGIPGMFIRDDALSTITPVEGDWAPGRVDATGAQWVSIASGSVTASGTVTAELSAVDNAVLDTIDAVLDTIKTDTAAISTAVGPVTPGTRVSLIDVDESEDEIKATAGTLYSLVVTNLASSTRYVRMYNATAASTTVGTTTPWRGPYAIPAGAGIVYVFERGLTFGTALCIAATTGVADADTGAPGANEVVAEVVYT